MAGGRTFLIKLFADSKNAEQGFKKVSEVAGGFEKRMLLVGAAVTAGFTAIVAGAVKVGKALFEVGQEFDDVFDGIRINTGATGLALEGLQDSFRAVAAQVPNDFADIGIAIRDLNTRLGVTGEPLEQLTIQLLTVSRLLEGDVQQNVRSITRLFGDFAVSTEEQADIIDVLFRASQQSGAAFQTLADQTVQYGASLRNLGFTLPESIALLASFERNGTNLETVMSGLRTAQSKLAKSGEPLSTALANVIQKIQTAESDTAGLTLAMETFGAKAGPDLYDAISTGRFAVEDLVDAIVNGSDTVLKAADDTDGLREAWQELKNYLKLQFEPIAMEVFNTTEGLIGDLRPAIDRVKAAFDQDGLTGALAQLKDEWTTIYETYIEPLWNRFLDFLREVVLPAAIELGEKIGAAIFNGIVKGASDALKEIGAGKYEFSARSAQVELARRTIVPTSSTRTLSGSTNLTFRADGGPVSIGRPYIVGEEGPELFVPNRMGTIVPNSGTGGGNVYVTVTGAIDPEGTARTIIRVLEDAQRRSGVRLAL